MVSTRKPRGKRISKALRDNMYMIRCLHEAKDDSRRGAMKTCSRGMCDALSEIADNTIKGNIPLTGNQYTALRRHAKDLQTLAKKKTPLGTRRNILQKGGFLGALLGPVVKFLMPVVKPLVSSLLPAVTGALGPQ